MDVNRDCQCLAAAASQEILEPNANRHTPGANGDCYNDYWKTTPDETWVYSHSPNTPGISFGDINSTDRDPIRTFMRIRTGKMNPAGANRATWNHVDFHGKGRVWAAFYLDGLRIPETGWAEAEASETPTNSRRILMPRGLHGYSMNIDMVCEGELLFVEADVDPVIEGI